MSAPSSNPPQTRRVLKPQPTIDPEEVDQQVKRKAHSRRVQAEDLVSGSYLHKVAAENLETFQKMAPTRPLGGSVSLSWASACSGSEGPRFVLEAMADVYRSMGIACSFDHLFSCEINPEKRQWIQNLNKHMPECMQSLRDLNVHMFDEPHSEEDPLTDSMDCAEERLLGGTDMDTPCVFGDIADLAGEYAHCHEHDGQCKVHDPDLFVIGTSCKDLSRANPSSAVRGQVVLGQSTSKGGSAQTFTGLKAFLEKHQPSMLLFENVDAIEDSKPSGGSNLEVLKSQLSALGYEGQVVKTDALEFGLPCHRRRVFAFFVRVVASPLFVFQDRPFDKVFETFRGLLAGCLRACPDSVDVLYANDIDAVQDELKARESKRLKLKDAAKAMKSKAKASAPANHGENWVEHHMKFAQTNHIKFSQKTQQADLAKNPWFLTLSEREQDALALCRVEKPNVLCRDLSQSIARVNSNTWDKERALHVLPTMMPRMLLWLELQYPNSPRLLLGQEALIMQGFPVVTFLRALKQHGAAFEPSESLMQDLAGNAMPLPVVLAMLQAGMCALSWRDGILSGCRKEGNLAKEKDRMSWTKSF